MTPYRKILLLLSTDVDHRQALARATLLAQAGDAQLVVQLFCDTKDDTAMHDDRLDEEVQRRGRETRQEWLDQVLMRLQAQGAKAAGTVVRGHPVREAMLAAILETEPDLTIKPAHHESALRRLFVTPDDWYLARFAPTPLLVVAESAERLPSHVIAAVDPASQRSPEALNARIVGAARNYASLAGADVHLAYVSQPVTDMLADSGLVGGVTPPEVVEEVLTQRRNAFDALAQRFEIPAEARHFLQGRVDGALNGLADEVGAGLIVVGSNYRSGFDRFLLGSTSEDLLANARHDVLVVKPENFDESLIEAAGLGRAQG